MQIVNSTALVWLRNDLRYHEQLSFFKAAKNHSRVVAYFSFDPKNLEKDRWGFRKMGEYRAKFLLETIIELQAELKKNNITLIISKEAPEKDIVHWVEKYQINSIYFQKEWTKEERETEEKLRANLNSDIKLHDHYDQFLFHPEDVPFTLEQLNNVFSVFRKKCEKYTSVRSLMPLPKALSKDNLLPQEFEPPSFEELGIDVLIVHPHSAFPFFGGTKEGHSRMDHYFWKSKKLSVYKKTRNGLLGPDYSSKFSPWLANGALSARTLYWEIKKYEQEVTKNESTYWLIFELIWRDYFKYVSLKYGDKIFCQGGILDKEYDWKKNEQLVNRWIDGTTQERFVNANMIELKKTGFMSNRGRQNVTSYFSKNLLLDWRIGAAYFEQQLIDYDVHSNYGNWMYVSGVGNDPRDRKFNVQLQASRYDEKGNYQNRWIQNTLFE